MLWQANSGQLKDLALLDQLLASHDDLAVKAFCENVERALAGQPAALPKPAASSVRENVVLDYLNEIRKLERDPGAFSAVLERLDRDKKARVQEVRKIASEYTGVDVGSMKKPEALDKIRYRQRNLSSTDQRNRGIGDIF